MSLLGVIYTYVRMFIPVFIRPFEITSTSWTKTISSQGLKRIIETWSLLVNVGSQKNHFPIHVHVGQVAKPSTTSLVHHVYADLL
jgi:hypothetical protein